MYIIKHLLKVFIMLFKQAYCKHSNVYTASCPVTEKTYTTCQDCWKRIKVEYTNGRS